MLPIVASLLLFSPGILVGSFCGIFCCKLSVFIGCTPSFCYFFIRFFFSIKSPFHEEVRVHFEVNMLDTVYQ